MREAGCLYEDASWMSLDGEMCLDSADGPSEARLYGRMRMVGDYGFDNTTY